MRNMVKFKIKTLSNLFIGGAPVSFEIGGIDQQTAMDPEGFPCIPGSSFKGALRSIIRNDKSNIAEEISQMYKNYLDREKLTNAEHIQELIREKKTSEQQEILERIKQRYCKAYEEISSTYLFGIEGFNNTPKLFFSDILLCEEARDKKLCFSIDMKNTIETAGSVPVSNPRTYKTARSGLMFEGEIRLHKIELLGINAQELCEKYLIDNLTKFNNGIYRLGNSKSRGYGKVQVIITNEDGIVNL